MSNRKGKGGRPRKPSALKVLHGDFDINPERENKREPKPDRGKPIRPAWIKGRARLEWQRICKLLDATTVLTKDMGPSLEQYCKAYELWRSALDKVEKHGMLIEKTDPNGNVQLARNPASTDVNVYSLICIRMLTEFGLTPSSRTRVQIENETNSKTDLAKKYLG